MRVASEPEGRASAEGSLRIAVDGGTAVRVPWVVTFGPTANTLLGPLHLSQQEFTPSDAAPALLTFQAGRILGTGGRAQVQPVASLELRLLRRDGTDLGSLVRLRDLLPGRYAFGLTGIRPLPYIVSTFIGILPGAIAFVYLGAAGAAVATQNKAKTIFTIVGVAIAFAVSIFVGRIAKRALLHDDLEDGADDPDVEK